MELYTRLGLKFEPTVNSVILVRVVPGRTSCSLTTYGHGGGDGICVCRRSLIRRLLAAAEAKSLALRQVEQQWMDLLPGEFVDALNGIEFAPCAPDGSFQSRLDAWRQAARTYGCLEEDPLRA